MARKQGNVEGVCRLTGEHGVFVESHLIPKALTRPDEPGLPFIEHTRPHGPLRKWSSWTDKGLVIRKGEDYLSRLDDWAIKELRRHKLVWSGWGPMISLGALHDELTPSHWGIRQVKISNPQRLRLFFLSLLWRAAATSNPAFSEVEMPEEDLEQLRQMIVNSDPEPLSFYPATLSQLSTLGTIHNLTPLAQTKVTPAIEDEPQRELPIFRFYFDGLIVHIHRQSTDDGYTVGLGPLVVGYGDKLTINTVTYSTSWEKENLETVIAESIAQWPERFFRLLPKNRSR
jgi:hypothetical protein